MRALIASAWHWLSTSRYTRHLEERLAVNAEIMERQRLEIFALVNSLLGTAGYPPVDVSGTPRAHVSPIRNPSWGQTARRKENDIAMKMSQAERNTSQERSV